MGKNEGFCTMSIKEFMPPYAEEISKSLMELYERGSEIESDIAKQTLTYAYECWKQGIYYIVNQTEFTVLRPTEKGEELKVKVHLACVKSKEELDFALKAGYNVCDFSKWTVEKFKEAGVEI